MRHMVHVTYPECPMGDDSDCFAVTRRRLCRALEDTAFQDGKSCPFYKTCDQEADDRATAVKRLQKIGRMDLIAHYRRGR